MSNNFNSSAGVVVVSGFHTSSVAVGNQIRVILMNRVVQADQASVMKHLILVDGQSHPYVGLAFDC